MDRKIINKIKSNPHHSVPKINIEMRDEENLNVSDQTIRNRLKSNGFNERIARKRHLLSKSHKFKLLSWANEHKNWTIEDWKKVLWSDETKINLFGSDGITRVWRKKEYGL